MEATGLDQAVKPGRLWIDGKQVDSVSGKTIEVINPATAQPLTRVERGDAEDINRAVEAARRAFEI